MMSDTNRQRATAHLYYSNSETLSLLCCSFFTSEGLRGPTDSELLVGGVFSQFQMFLPRKRAAHHVFVSEQRY